MRPPAGLRRAPRAGLRRALPAASFVVAVCGARGYRKEKGVLVKAEIDVARRPWRGRAREHTGATSTDRTHINPDTAKAGGMAPTTTPAQIATNVLPAAGLPRF